MSAARISRVARRASRILSLLVAGAASLPLAAQENAAAVVPESDAAPVQAQSKLVLVPYPISDPSLGKGLLLGPVWMRDGPKAATGPGKPQAYGAGALWTDGGSRGLLAFDHRAWAEGRWRTTAVVGVVELHFNYSGLFPSNDDGIGFGVEAEGASVSGDRLLAGGPNHLGVGAFLARASVGFDDVPPALADRDVGVTDLRGINLGWSRDTRDDVFLPASGTAMAARATVFSEALGSSFEARRVDLKWTGYRRLGKGVLGLRGRVQLAYGDPPFYLRPYVSFRGIPALRYAGEQVLAAELEYRHPIRGSWDALAFVGSGRARADFRGLQHSHTVSAGGVGIRFKVVKLFGLTFGLDVAQGPDGLATYVQIGNAWSN